MGEGVSAVQVRKNAAFAKGVDAVREGSPELAVAIHLKMSLPQLWAKKLGRRRSGDFATKSILR